MTFAEFNASNGWFAVLLIVVVIGWLPTEIWRLLAVWLARDLDENSEILIWVRLVASTLLAAVVAKIILAPTGAMSTIPLWGRLGGVFAGLATFAVTRRSVILAVLVGEATLLLAGLLAP